MISLLYYFHGTYYLQPDVVLKELLTVFLFRLKCKLHKARGSVVFSVVFPGFGKLLESKKYSLKSH